MYESDCNYTQPALTPMGGCGRFAMDFTGSRIRMIIDTSTAIILHFLVAAKACDSKKQRAF